MTASAPYPSRSSSAYGPYGSRMVADWELSPGERISPLRRGSRLMRAVRRLVALIAIGGAGWFYWTQPDRVNAWVEPTIAAVSTYLTTPGKRDAGPPPREVLAASAPVLPEPLAPTRTLEPEPAATPSPPVVEPAVPPPAKTGAPATPDATSETMPPQPYTPAKLPPPPPATDPLQKRAEAVGLHPGLSPVLLARLSPVDFANAGVAIRKALADTPGDAVYVWPKRRRPNLAQFKVFFVEGAPPTCRRYVVAIAKDGWLTTALPLEKCGLKRPPLLRSAQPNSALRAMEAAAGR